MTKKKSYYNEIDPYAAEWLRNLIVAGEIAPGDVDTRSIEDVRPSDLTGYTQCHFFAGVGVWSYALRRAGWPDDKPIWTGSCPCQPFSAAGKGLGFADQRHLWPLWHYLIEQCQPPAVLGEQVASKDADPWIDLVHTDMEALGYAFGAVPFPSAGIGAPHIRDRLYWVAHATNERQHGRRSSGARHGRHQARVQLERLCNADGRGQPHRPGPQGGERGRELHDAQLAPAERAGEAVGVADPDIAQQRPEGQPRVGDEHDAPGRVEGATAVAGLRGDLRPRPTNGLWRDADWLLCRDGKWRPVEPGTFPLAHGAPARVGRLRAYGNAINVEAAVAFIEAVMA